MGRGVPAGAAMPAQAVKAKPGTPPPIIARLYGEMAKILATPDAIQWFESVGVEPGGETPEALAAIVRADNARLGEVIRALAIKAE